MDQYQYTFYLSNQLKKGPITKVGVAGSGNLEVIIKPLTSTNKTTLAVYTTVSGFQNTWDEVIKRYINDYPYAGLHIELYDAGATPAVVSLRLRQALETYQKGYYKKILYTQASARNRVYSLVDENSFKEFLLDKKTPSPTLLQLNMQVESDDGVVIGTAQFDNIKVAIVSQETAFIGGSVGEVHGAKINGLIKYAIKHQLPALVLLIDSGGVRLQEANVGEIEISEIIRSLLDARSAGVKTIGVICGNNGAYGGMGIVSGVLDYLIVNQGARIGISGPEVIQAVQGTEVLDSNDRPLTWRIYGGRTRYMQKAVQAYTGKTIKEIRTSIIDALQALQNQPKLNLEQIQAEHEFLQKRIDRASLFQEQGEWLAHYASRLNTQEVFNCSDDHFLSLAQGLRDE